MIGNGSVRNPHLISIEEIMISPVFSQTLHAGDIRPDISFRHRETADIFAADEFRNVVLFLFFCAEFLNGQGRTPALHVESHAPGSMDFGDLLDDQSAFEKTHTVSAVFFIYAETEET